VTTKVIQHLGSDTCLVEELNGSWKCVIFIDNTVISPGIMGNFDLRAIFPMNSQVMVNAELVNPNKAIQYIATLAWNQTSFSANEPDRKITESHYMRYYDVIDTMGKVLDTVSKLSLNKTKDLLLSKPGKVFKILDQNFGLLEIEEGLVLFDTCDFFLSPDLSADKAGKGLDQVVAVGAKIMTHACLVDINLKIPYLATSVWVYDNHHFNYVNKYPNPIQRKDIHSQKIDNFLTVVESVKDTISDAEVMIKHDPKDVVLWQMAKVRAIFLDRGYKEHGSMICGLVHMNIGIGFFISKSFAKLDAIPNVGMDEYVNVYPCNRINPKNPQQFASIDFICTNLYPTYFNSQTAVPPNPQRLTEIIDDTTEILLKVITKFPHIRNPMAFIGNGTFHEIDICAKNEPPRQVPAPVVQQVAPVPRPLAKVESQNTMEEQIEIHASYLRCMIDDTSGVLKFDSGGSVEKFCYFEFSDLNIEKPHQLLDIVMILNRMNGIRVQFQGRLVNAKNKIQYVAHLNGVQVVGKLPNFMSGIKLKSNPVSRIQAGLNGEKVQRYKPCLQDPSWLER